MAGIKRYNRDERPEAKRTLKKDYTEAMSILIASERRRAYREAETEVVSRYSRYAIE